MPGVFLGIRVNHNINRISIPSDSLLAKWEFNGDVLDSSGNGNDWTTVTGASLTTDRNGVINRAYDFDGNNDLMSRNTIRIPDNKFTVCFWVKGDAWANHDVLFGVPGPSFISGYAITYYGGAIRFWVGKWSSVVNGNHIDFALTDTTEWHFVMAAYDKSVQKMYFSLDNGVVDNISLNLDLNTQLASIATQYISKNEVGFFNGKMDKIYFYNRLLTAQEITAIYNDTV